MRKPTTRWQPEEAYPDPDGSVLRQIQALEAMTVRELQEKHRELYGFATKSKHKRQLFKRLAWRVQERKWGGIPKEVTDHLRSIEDDRDARFLPPSRPRTAPTLPERSPRRGAQTPVRTAASVGSVLEREYGGVIHRVTILDKGVEYAGRRFSSLSAVAREITGTHWSGPRFFGLTGGSR